MAQFQAGFAGKLITFMDEERSEKLSELQSEMSLAGHRPVLLNDKKWQPFCCVCKLEENWQTKIDNIKDEQGKSSRLQKHLCKCQNSECKLKAHYACVDHERKIFMLPKFENMWCFEIAHSTVCRGLFQPMHKSDNHMSYPVATSHPLYLHIRRMYILPEKRQQWGKWHEVKTKQWWRQDLECKKFPSGRRYYNRWTWRGKYCVSFSPIILKYFNFINVCCFTVPKYQA